MIVFNVVIGGFSGMDLKYLAHVTVRLQLLLYIVLTISILIGQEPSAYFENSRVFVDKHDYLSNRPQVSTGYKLINHAGCW